MAAERLSQAGLAVTVYDRMPSMGRKLLMAGRGGLNLTHSEPLAAFLPRYGAARRRLEPALAGFPPDALRGWCEALGQPTFVGSSGRVFPVAMKASPLLRAWLARLTAAGVRLVPRTRWTGWEDDGRLSFADAPPVAADVTVLALGGASWPRLGSDGGWVAALQARGVAVTPLQPANGGIAVAWTPVFRDRFAGAPLKNFTITWQGETARGDAVVTLYGIEGGPIYALFAALRDAILRDGAATPLLDLRPDVPLDALAARLRGIRSRESLSNALRKAAGLSPLAVNLLRECAGVDLPHAPERLAALVKAAPLRLTGLAPLGRAISTAGGIALDEVDAGFMLQRLPGVFTAGEMLDWEAPTGGYLLQASLATGRAAAEGALAWLAAR